MRHEVTVAGATLTLDAAAMAQQADGAVVVRHRDAMVLAAVVSRATANPPPFFPLTVDYRERVSGSGRIPGGYTRREGPPGDREVLASRLIDRALRPLFPAGLRWETQVDVTCYGADEATDMVALGLLAAAAAVHVSDVPCAGPVVGVRVTRVDGAFLAWASESARNKADLDVMCAYTRDGVVTLEGACDEVDTDTLCEAIAFARAEAIRLLDALDAVRARDGRPPRAYEPVHTPVPALEAAAAVAAEHADALFAASTKRGRRAVDEAARAALAARLLQTETPADLAGQAFELARKRLLRERALASVRLGGRGPDDIRDVTCEVGVLTSNHGSALFTRGETQALVSATLAPPDDTRTYETVFGRETQRFMLHYNFPSFAVGEVGRSLRPGRREVGHGALARRAILPVLPTGGDMPYAIRVVSDVLGSDGSSSMATVCGASLALMDAGVQLARPVAGLALGLVYPDDGDDAAPIVVVDILGDEDAAFDMDMKAAGTERGLTALQMDNKRGSLADAALRQALDVARRGIERLVAVMADTLPAPRERVAANAPQASVVRIPKARVGLLIGPGGKTIQELQQRTRSRIEVNDRGRVRIFARSREDLDAAEAGVAVIAGDLTRGAVYDAEVVSLKAFGAFVRVGSHEGLVHVSDLSADGAPPDQVVRVGDVLRVKVLGANHRGQLELSALATR